MPKGKPWTTEEEIKLKTLLMAGENLDKISALLGRNKAAIAMKVNRMGLEVVVANLSESTTTSIQLPPELPTPEEALKMLAGALKATTQPGLTRTEVQRLQVLSRVARAYDHLLANYIHYREIETKLLELERKYAQLTQKTKNNAPTPNSTIPTQT
jgi:hypothetical protein